MQERKATQLQRSEARLAGAECIGETSLLKRLKLGLLCSQKCPGDVILKSYDFAREFRSSGHAIVSGFHSPIEKDCLPVLLRGSAPIIIVQGRRLSTTRLPEEWQKAITAGRLLLVSPFSDKEKRVTAQLAEERNRFVAALADEILIAYAYPNGKTEKLARELLNSGKRVYTFNSQYNAALIKMGAVAIEPDYFCNKLDDTSV